MVRHAFAALLTIFMACAQAAAQNSETFHPALFVVRDADSTLYLYGSIHAQAPDAPWGDERIRRALDEADEVWTESDISVLNLVRAALETAFVAPRIPPPPLSSRLSAPQRARLARVIKPYGMTISDFDGLQPWEVPFAVSRVSPTHLHVTFAAGVDSQLARAARRAHKPVHWLERLGVHELDALPDDVQIDFMMSGLDSMSGDHEDFAFLHARWAAGDLDAIASEQVEDMRVRYPALYRWILVQRNTAWTEELAAQMQGSGVDFVVVGAMHLAGPDSLIELLRARGYSVERVMPEE